MYKALLICLLAMIGYVARAQKASETDTLRYYLDKDNKIVVKKDSAAYLLIIYPRDPNERKKLFPFRQFYINGKLRSVGFSTEHSPYLTFDGPIVNFFPNGRRQSTATHKDGRPTGNYIQNYSNGKLYAIQQYTDNNKAKYIECRDTSGNLVAEKGNGKWLELDETFTKPIKYCAVVDGVIDNKWHPITDTSKYAYYSNTGTLLTKVAIRPTFQRSYKAPLNEVLDRYLDYPAEDVKENRSGEVQLRMIVEKDGSLTHMEALNAPSTTLKEEALRLIGLTSPWVPGSAIPGGPPERVQLELTVKFRLILANGKPENKYVYVTYISGDEDSASGDLVVKVDKLAEYPGGLEAFGNFMHRTIRYPESDRKNKISGKVIVEFIVERDGTLIDIKALRGPSEAMKEEAVRVLRLSPKWKPALFEDKPVRSLYKVPISFSGE